MSAATSVDKESSADHTAPFWKAVDLAVEKSFQVNEVPLPEVVETLDRVLR